VVPRWFDDAPTASQQGDPQRAAEDHIGRGDEGAMASAPGIEQHPDLVELRDKYDRAAARPMVQVLDGLTVLAGLYLAISPWVLGFNGLHALAASNLIVGLAYCVVAMGFVAAFGRTHGIAWTAPIMGVWVIVSPWVIRGVDASTTTTMINNIIVGAVCVLLGLAAMSVGTRRMMPHR
jgi:hypothetical protein